MSKTQKHFLKIFSITILIFFIINIKIVSAENEKIEIKSGTNKFKDLIFSVPPNSEHTGELIVENKGEEDIDVVLFIANDEKTTLVEAMNAKEGKDLFFNTLFYFDAPPEKYQNILKKNGGEITVLCEEYSDNNDKALKKWCEGDRSTTVTIKAGESEHVPFTVKFLPNVVEHNAYVTAVLEDRYDNKVLDQKKLTYKFPVEKIDVNKVKLESLI